MTAAWTGRVITRCTAVEAADGELVRVLLGVAGAGHHALGADPAARHGALDTPWREGRGAAARTVLATLRRGLVLDLAAALAGEDGRPRGVVLGTAAGTVVLVHGAGRLDVLAVQDAAPRAIVRAA